MHAPHILIIPRDEDGDVVVLLKKFNPRWHMAADGRTLGQALRALSEAILLAEADERLYDQRPSIGLAVRALLADRQSHTQDEVIATLRQKLGNQVRVPAIIAALRGKGIERRAGDSYQLTERS